MPHHKSAIKRVRQNGVRNERNRAWRSKLRTLERKYREAVEAGSEETEQLLRTACATFQRAANKGIIHANTAARKVSRLQSSFNKIKAVQA